MEAADSSESACRVQAGSWVQKSVYIPWWIW